MESARSIREDFLQQNAFEDEDSYTALDKQFAMMELVFFFEDKAKAAVAEGVDVEDIANLPVRESVGRFKAVPYASYKSELEAVKEQINAELNQLISAVRA